MQCTESLLGDDERTPSTPSQILMSLLHPHLRTAFLVALHLLITQAPPLHPAASLLWGPSDDTLLSPGADDGDVGRLVVGEVARGSGVKYAAG